MKKGIWGSPQKIFGVYIPKSSVLTHFETYINGYQVN